MKDVVAAKKVMEQNIFGDGDGSHPSAAMVGMHGAVSQLAQNQETLEDNFGAALTRLDELEESAAALPTFLQSVDAAMQTAHNAMRDEFTKRLDAVNAALHQEKTAMETRLQETREVAEKAARDGETQNAAIWNNCAPTPRSCRN